MKNNMKCNECGKRIRIGNRPDGLPNGVGFELADGRIINVCADCLIEAGKKVNACKKQE